MESPDEYLGRLNFPGTLGSSERRGAPLQCRDGRSQLLEYDKELSVFKDRLHELEISFPPRDLTYRLNLCLMAIRHR
ncbi:hypothetical protein D4764_11G0001230 [Takifugu flavidus]|uniref:Uncharacterized protein n=1 Tax=Takifugu flavidus TaxID=433684 RepID=A0A5C6PE49_9TELE|nr:hypothetical protein D4764_11G0001230 [Takifugu flavidus]